jgi:hypothetical protein
MLFNALLILTLYLHVTQAKTPIKMSDCRPLNTCKDETCGHTDLVTNRGCEWAASRLQVLF